jgi:signal transduction histidine kinase
MSDVSLKMNKLVIEEIKATKLFLWLFYIIFLAFDGFYYFVIPALQGREMGFPKESLGIWVHIIVLGFLPLLIYLLKQGNAYHVKYYIFIGYNVLDLINGLIMYSELMKAGEDVEFNSGNAVELLFVLFSALFLNKKYFWFANLGVTLKYVIYGVYLNEPFLILGIVILTVLSSVSYLFLYRFQSYIRTLEKINEELRQKEKLAIVGQLATSIGHEIRNPLAALKGFTQLQNEKYPDDKGFYEIMENEIERINLIVNDLMYMGKPKSLFMQNNDLKELIQYVLNILRPIANANQVNIELDLDNLPEINCDGNQLKQVFINLIKNAIESMPLGGTITISSKLVDKDRLTLLIVDEGSGMEQDKINMLGQPFFTTKADGNGLGLMVTFNIIEQHNGKIVYQSVLGKGTVVELNLPIDGC